MNIYILYIDYIVIQICLFPFHLCMHACMYACTCLCCVWRPEDKARCHRLAGTILCDSISQWPGAHQLCWTNCPVSPRDPPVSTSPALASQMHATMPGVFTQVLKSELKSPYYKIKTLLTESSQQAPTQF